jgi:hypothetical protein
MFKQINFTESSQGRWQHGAEDSGLPENLKTVAVKWDIHVPLVMKRLKTKFKHMQGTVICMHLFYVFIYYLGELFYLFILVIHLG